MLRTLPFVLLGLSLTAAPSFAQGEAWRPPGSQMPAMPTNAELDGDWLGSRAAWFGGIRAVSGVAPAALRAVGEPRGATTTRVVRFQDGPMPIVVWTDRDGDGDADFIEIYRSGGIIIQLIDADYDGRANVIRRYDASGALISEERI